MRNTQTTNQKTANSYPRNAMRNRWFPSDDAKILKLLRETNWSPSKYQRAALANKFVNIHTTEAISCRFGVVKNKHWRERMAAINPNSTVTIKKPAKVQESVSVRVRPELFEEPATPPVVPVNVNAVHLGSVEQQGDSLIGMPEWSRKDRALIMAMLCIRSTRLSRQQMDYIHDTLETKRSTPSVYTRISQFRLRYVREGKFVIPKDYKDLVDKELKAWEKFINTEEKQPQTIGYSHPNPPQPATMRIQQNKISIDIRVIEGGVNLTITNL